MGDPRQHVRPGQRLQLAAEQVNFLNGLMRAAGGFGSGHLTSWQQGTNIVTLQNGTGDTLERGGVLEITGIVINPETNSSTESSFCEMPCVAGSAPREDSQAIAIAAEPIAAGKIGRAFVSGVAVARVSMASPEHQFAKTKFDELVMESCRGGSGAARILWSSGELGERWALVRIGESQSIVLGKFEGSWGVGQMKSVRLYSPVENAIEEYVDALNVFCYVGEPCGPESWCALSRHFGAWYLLAAGCG